MPTFNPPRRVEVILHDDDGSKRVAVAERARGYTNLPHWDLSLQHPSGRAWPATFNGSSIGDALFALVEQKDQEYNSERSRGHRVSQMLSDRNVPIDDGGHFTRASLLTHQGQPVAFGRAAAAAARARSAARRG